MSITAKGAARRDALLDATIRVLERDGVGGVTHRAVAAEAGVPLAAATYYFATLDDLYVQALRRASEEQERLFAALEPGSIRSAAELLHECIHGRRAWTIAQYELMLLATRRDAMRDDAERWYLALEAAIDPDGRDPVRRRVIALAVDGLMLRMLWLGDPATVDGIAEQLTAILERTRATTTGTPTDA